MDSFLEFDKKLVGEDGEALKDGGILFPYLFQSRRNSESDYFGGGIRQHPYIYIYTQTLSSIVVLGG